MQVYLEAGELTKEIKIKIVDDDYFPTNYFRSQIQEAQPKTRTAIDKLPELHLFREYVKMNYTNKIVRLGTWKMMLVMLLHNLYFVLRLQLTSAGYPADAAAVALFTVISMAYGQFLVSRLWQSRQTLLQNSRRDDVTELLTRRAFRHRVPLVVGVDLVLQILRQLVETAVVVRVLFGWRGRRGQRLGCPPRLGSRDR